MRAACIWFVGFTHVKTLLTDIETWHPTQSPLAIEYTRSVLDEVRDQAVAGYRRLSRGGVEVGGILYGTRDTGKVRILATQPIACEYKSGPSFLLSEKDKHRLLDQLTGSESVPELQGLVVVGWYVAHPRNAVALTDGDLDIFNEFFPAIWNVALVLKPNDQSIRCGFFVREARGSLNIEQSYQEFELALPRSSEGSSAIRQIADQVSSSLAAQRAQVPEADTERRRGGSRRDISEMPPPPGNGRALELPPTFVAPGSNGTGTAAAPAFEAPLPNWSTAVARPRASLVANRRAGDQPRRLKWRWLVVWLLAIAAIVGGAYAYREYTAPAQLGLHVAEKDGDLIIQWDPASRSLRWATAGKIEIKGTGQTKIEIDLTTKEVASGKYQYGGTEGDTSIRLSVNGKLGFHADESTRYVAQAAQTAESNSKPVEIRDRRKLQNEVRRLRDELDKSQQRVKDLESLLYDR